MAEAVAQRDQAAERADGPLTSVCSGSRARSSEAARSSTGSCEPIATIVRSTASRSRSSRTSTWAPASWPSSVGGHDEQPVGAHERGEHAGAARQRGGDQPAADAAEADADPVVGAERGRQPAGEPRLRAGTLDRRRALERGQQRDARRSRTSARPRPDSPGAPSTGVPSTVPSTTGWPGLTATPCTSERPVARDDVGGVVVAAGARAGDHDHEVGPCRGLRDRGPDLRGVVREHGSDSTVQPTSRACAASISELVSTSSPGAGSEPSGRTSSPVGITMTCGARRTVSVVWPAARRGGQVDGAQPVALGQQQLGRADVLADRAHVLPRAPRPPGPRARRPASAPARA